jgi:thiosulfate reductase cytochrome b subunit
MNRENKYILAALILIVLIIVYFSVFCVKENFTPDIRGMYNPNKRNLRIYSEKLKKQANEYVNNLRKTFSWA